ncbi:hypothetical protein DSL72_001321 [Monilinia vaccinii-corymbosi]|uniref:Uncharacterized protein n=1 Tax=Monilinia vaccinii-corymbosi TaxID=61207 RepID=A0A8A3P1Q1_9HELO|nr:hypothetical protein DSL72_001321 [Monilinia vaccinii-corymbosi]
MIASLGLFFLDRGVRILRTLGMHVGYFDANGNAGGSSAVSASIQLNPHSDISTTKTEASSVLNSPTNTLHGLQANISSSASPPSTSGNLIP